MPRLAPWRGTSLSPVDIGYLSRQVPRRYPFVLVDRVIEHDPAGRLVAIKNVTGSEEFFQGHFPGTPVMPGVLVMECLAQAASIWLLAESGESVAADVRLVGIDRAKFRCPVVPGDRLNLEIRVERRRGTLVRASGQVTVANQRVAEGRFLLYVGGPRDVRVHPTAQVHPTAVLGLGVRIGPYSVVGPGVEIGARTVLQSHVVVQGPTVIGEDNDLFPYASIGLAPQDLKYRGEASRLEVGDRNKFREFVTIHRGTEVGGGVTTIGSDNLFMAYVHIAHDCHVGNRIIFGNAATLAGHIEVADWANVGAFSGVHQFCRVGEHAFLGGSSVATKDVLPYSMTVGNRACIYGVNRVGLTRRGFTEERIHTIRSAFRVLLQSRLNTTRAVERLEQTVGDEPEVRILLDFINSSRRGVILKRHRRPHHSDDSFRDD